tara:strand:- start:636 stop:1556 length:921 start_codon:yes stop_codon:yes gene_type:complete
MSKGTVVCNFTIGFGNNIFQYCFSRLLAEKNNLQLQNADNLNYIGVGEQRCKIDSALPTVVVDDSNYKKALFVENFENCNVFVNGYFEDYKIFKPYLGKIRTWFDKNEATNKDDLILHLRLQNRLIQVSHNKNHITAKSFKDVIKTFDYDKLHIVTDAEKWDFHTLEDIEKIRHEITIGPNPPTNSPWVEKEQSLEYINHLVGELAELNPVTHCSDAGMIKGSGGLRDSFIQDFNLLRSFNQVIIHNSTFSWWAATLSGAQKVAIFSPWKIAKKPEQRRNLGATDFPGWSSWGCANDLYFKKYGVK